MQSSLSIGMSVSELPQGTKRHQHPVAGGPAEACGFAAQENWAGRSNASALPVQIASSQQVN